jgi:mercuric ion transport protein
VIRIELIYDADCPNVGNTRGQLLKALVAAGLAPRWQEWDRAASDSPSYVRCYGSPTILLNGRDVASGGEHEGAGACRIYRDANGATIPVPPLEPLVAALKDAAAGGNPIDTPPSFVRGIP